MDSLEDVFISDEEEPQPKTRKTKIQKPTPKTRLIKRSNFIQVSNKIYDKNYKKWINKNFRRIDNFFTKVNFFTKTNFHKILT